MQSSAALFGLPERYGSKNIYSSEMRTRQWTEVSDDLRVQGPPCDSDPPQKHHPPLRTRGQKVSMKYFHQSSSFSCLPIITCYDYTVIFSIELYVNICEIVLIIVVVVVILSTF